MFLKDFIISYKTSWISVFNWSKHDHLWACGRNSCSTASVQRTERTRPTRPCRLTVYQNKGMTVNLWKLRRCGVAFRNMLGPPHVIVSVEENAQESKNVNQHQQHCLSNLDSEDSEASVHNVAANWSHSINKEVSGITWSEWSDSTKGSAPWGSSKRTLRLKLSHVKKGLSTMQAEIYQLSHHQWSHWALKFPWKTHEEWTKLRGLPPSLLKHLETHNCPGQGTPPKRINKG